MTGQEILDGLNLAVESLEYRLDETPEKLDITRRNIRIAICGLNKLIAWSASSLHDVHKHIILDVRSSADEEASRAYKHPSNYENWRTKE